MDGKHITSVFIVDCVHQINYADDGYDGSEDEFQLIKKVTWNVPIAAVLDVVDFEQGKQPQKCTWYVDEHCLFKAWR